jgi:putative copper export protein
MPILLAGTIEIVHIEQVSALFTFRLGQVLLYKDVVQSHKFFLGENAIFLHFSYKMH